MSVSNTIKNDGILRNLDSKDYMIAINSEDQTWMSLPVSVKYNFVFPTIPKLKAYANLGGSLDYLLTSKRTSDGSTLTLTNAPVVGFNTESTQDKNRLNYGIIAGGGVTFKASEGFISLEVRYLHSLSKLVKSDNVLNPTDAAQLNTGVQDDIYRLNHIAISLGYTLNVYMPKQLR